METSAITAPEWHPVVSSVEGRFAEASNATLLGETEDGERVIYKPVAGIQPLWDFDAASLVAREVWTHQIDEALGTDVVPQTVFGDGVYGPGAVQRFVDAVADEAVVELINSASQLLWPIAVLDIVTNNADRKAGHVLRSESDRLWAIDHGLTFHTDPKLRTILWGLAGQKVPAELIERLQRLSDRLAGDLGEAFVADLSREELNATRSRVDAVLASQVHPEPPQHRPAVPWPPY